MTIAAPTALTADILRKKFSATDELVWIPATEAEYWSFAHLPEFRIEYIDGQIVGTMAYATENHELIVMNIGTALNNALSREGYKIVSSNRPIYAEACNTIFNPDAHVFFGENHLYRYDKTKTATMNPSVIIEVLSDSTQSFDFNKKLPCYKKIPSLQHVIFIDQHEPYIEVFSRTKKPHEWLNTDYNDLTQRFKIHNKYIALKDIYQHIIFKIK